MSRDFRHGQHVRKPPVRKPHGKDVKFPTKQQKADELRHAVRHSDVDALEEYDEWRTK